MPNGHAPLVLPSWREGILPVRVLVPDSSVRSMNDQLGALIAGNSSSDTNRIFLCGGACSGAGVTLSFNLPTTVGVSSYMLVLTHGPHLTSSGLRAHNEDT